MVSDPALINAYGEIRAYQRNWAEALAARFGAERLPWDAPRWKAIIGCPPWRASATWRGEASRPERPRGHA